MRVDLPLVQRARESSGKQSPDRISWIACVSPGFKTLDASLKKRFFPEVFIKHAESRQRQSLVLKREVEGIALLEAGKVGKAVTGMFRIGWMHKSDQSTGFAAVKRILLKVNRISPAGSASVNRCRYRSRNGS